MTLNLTIVNRHGAWQSSDHRLTDLASGKCVDDSSVKHVILRCTDGSALLAYAGLGKTTEGVTISDWLHEILRGKSRTVDDSIATIGELATRDLGPRLYAQKFHHMFTIAAFIQARPWIIQIRNFSVVGGHNRSQPTRTFQIVRRLSEVGYATVFPEVSISTRDRETLKRVCTKKPRHPIEFARLLGGINKRTSLSNTSVSPQCVITYMPPEGLPCESRYFNGTKERTDLAPTVPVILFGVDLTDAVREQVQAFLNLKRGVSVSEMQHRIEEVAKHSILPKNRLEPK